MREGYLGRPGLDVCARRSRSTGLLHRRAFVSADAVSWLVAYCAHQHVKALVPSPNGQPALAVFSLGLARSDCGPDCVLRSILQDPASAVYGPVERHQVTV